MNRIEVNGIILSATNDVEAVTVFNKTSNEGTITNFKGEFEIKIALNDVIEISALQFQTLTISIDADALKSKQLKILLIEQVNQLKAVTLSSGLSGNIVEDITNAKVIKSLAIDMGDINAAFEYNDEKAFDAKIVEQELNEITRKGDFYNGINFVNILGPLFNSLLKSKKSTNNNIDIEKAQKVKRLIDLYTFNKISETFNIPIDDIGSFIAYVEDKGVKQELLKPENEIYLIEFLFKQRELFLKIKDDKN